MFNRIEHSQSAVHINRPLAHVTLMTEGVRPKLSELKNFIRRYEPRVRKDSVTLLDVFISRWPQVPVDYIVRSTAQVHPRYFSASVGVNITFDEFQDNAGMRTMLLRVYYNPDELVSKDFEQRVITLTAHERQKDSSWLSRLFVGS
jgi:hypothetical protein